MVVCPMRTPCDLSLMLHNILGMNVSPQTFFFLQTPMPCKIPFDNGVNEKTDEQQVDSSGEQEGEAMFPVLAHVATVFVSCLEIPSTASLESNTIAYVA